MRSKKSTSQITVGQYLLNHLLELGVKHIFGVPGDYVIRFNKITEESPIKFINSTRENTAGFMGDAYSRLKGLGASCITYGVGINIANAVSQAYAEGSPLVIISGAPGQAEFSKSFALHHLTNKSTSHHRDKTQLEIMKLITVDQAVLEHPETAASQIDKVIDSCLKLKKPVYIELPRDIVDKPIAPGHVYSPKSKENSHPEILRSALNELKQILVEAKRPILWLGREIQSFQKIDAILEFAEKYHIPIVTSIMGKGVLDERHPLFVGVYQGALSRPEVKDCVDKSDCLIGLGLLWSDTDSGCFTACHPSSKGVMANASSIMISYHHYHQIFFPDFIDELTKLNLPKKYKYEFPKNKDRLKPFKAVKKANMTVARLLDAIEFYLKPGIALATDVGDCLFGSSDLTVYQNGYVACPYFGTLGFGVPAAIGAQIADPNLRIICLVGDGGFQMTATELATAVRYGLDPIVIVMNNRGYGTERLLIDGTFNDVVNWKYTELPKVLGAGKGIYVKTEEEFVKALSETLNAKRGKEFTIIEVELSQSDFSPGLTRMANLVADKFK